MEMCREGVNLKGGCDDNFVDSANSENSNLAVREIVKILDSRK